MIEAKVVALHLKPTPGQLQPVDSLSVVAGKGFEGDANFGRQERQSLFTTTEHLDSFGYPAGALREQVTVNLPGLQKLPAGAKIRVGDVVFEIEKDCTPCTGMANRLGEDPETFKAKTAFKRGMFAKAISDGSIRTGDIVTILESR